MSPSATIQIHTKQADFLDSDATFRAFCGGRGVGKSFIGAYDLLKRARPERLYMAVAPTYTMLEDAAWRAFIQIATDLRFLRDVNQQRHRVTLGNGAEVIFRTGDEPERLRGPNLSGLWLDEASVMSREVYEIGIACLRQGGEQGWLSATFTPKGQAHWTYEVFGTGRPDTALVHAATLENPFLPPNFEQTMLLQYGEELARQELGGEFVDLSDALVVVPLSLARLAELATYEPALTEIVAADIARYGNDKSVIVSRRGRVVRTVAKVRGASTMELAGLLAEYKRGHKHAHIVVDGTGVGSGVVDRLREMGIGVIDFQGGASADDSGRFANKVAEVWWRMREGYERGLDTETDDELRGQVSSRRYTLQSDRRIRLESKDDMRAEGRHSPDEADAVAMTFALEWAIDGARLQAGSDVPTADEPPRQRVVYSKESARPTLAGVGQSRWGKARLGQRR